MTENHSKAIATGVANANGQRDVVRVFNYPWH